jgi:hypothetical protein
MSLPGGPADKIGNRYEEAWTVYAMAQVMDEQFTMIRLEPPGVAGMEFWIQRADRLEYHQVKRERSVGASWSLADLHREKVLLHFWQKLADGSAYCVFVSEYPAHELKHLAARAQNAVDWCEFQREFLKAEKKAENFDRLCNYWDDCPPEKAYEALKRIIVRSKEEQDLREAVVMVLRSLVDGPPTHVYTALVQLAKDNIHGQFTAHNIWHHLESPQQGFHRRRWANDLHVLARVKGANDAYLLSQDMATIAGNIIKRDETQGIVQQLTAPESENHTLITGEAGSGKSCTFQQVVEALLEQGTPVLALRLDLLEPTLLPRDIGQQHDLPGSPVTVLGDVAQGQRCVLAIDQFDVMNSASDRYPKFLHCMDALLTELRAYPQMRLLVACRQFELEHDEFIQKLFAKHDLKEPVVVGRLTQAQVRETATTLGWDAWRLSEKQVELLSYPLHLSLLAKVPRSAGATLDFNTANDLYARLWRYKDEALRRRLRGQAVRWVSVLDALCNYMSERQILFAPESTVYGNEFVADAIVSEQVLIKNGRRYAFFHESFFDYAFARQFVAGRREPVPFLQQGTQSLFRREQVRQILAQERAEYLSVDDPRYLSDLKALLTDGGVRSHIKQVVFAVLAELSDPTPSEWQVLAALLDDPASPHQQDVWNILQRSIPWFHLLDSLGVIEQWVTSQDEVRLIQVVMLLATVQRVLPDRVAELVEPFIGKEPWRTHFLSIVFRADLRASRRFLELFLRLIDDGTLDDIITARDTFWSLVSLLPKDHPQWACEAIGHYFQRRFLLTVAAGQANPFEFTSGTTSYIPRGDGIFKACAAGAPVTFVDQLLPFMVVMMQQTVSRKGLPPWRDSVWGWRHYGEGLSVSSELLGAMAQALSQCAADQPEAFAPFASLLRSLEFETAHFLLIRAYAANGARFADEAANYLCESPQHLRIGYTEDVHWTAHELIEAITPHCSPTCFTELEECLLAYYPEHEKRPAGQSSFRYAQFSLLSGITPSRRSEKGARRLAELQRRFGAQTPRAPVPFEQRTGWVESPIPPDAVEKMTDEHWERAMAHYRYEYMDIQPDKPFVGGAFQLSQLLEPQARKDPLRFAQLLCQLPGSVHPFYVDAILRGISDANLDERLVLRVCRYCHDLPGRPCGRWLCEFIGKQASISLPVEILEMVAWYAVEDTEEEQAVWRINENGEQFKTPDDIVSAGDGMARGGAARAIGELIRLDGSRVFSLLPALEALVCDSSISVRACAAQALRAILPQYRELAVVLFQRLCEADDTLLGTWPIASFLYGAVRTHFTGLVPLLERMLCSEKPEANSVAAQTCCLASLIVDDAGNLAHSCMSGTEAQRVGAAKVFAANICSSSHRATCEEALTQLFHDPVAQVRSEAAMCFRHFQAGELEGCSDLVQKFIDSPAFATTPYELLDALERTATKHSSLTCMVCEKFLDIFASEVKDRYSMRGLHATSVGKLILAVYRYSKQEKDEELLIRSLDVIDHLTRLGLLDLKL